MGLSKTIRGSLSALGLGSADDTAQRHATGALAHAWRGETPEFVFHRPRPTVRPRDLDLAERVIQAFHSARATESCLSKDQLPSGDRWEQIGAERHAEFHKLLTQRNVKGVAKILVNAMQDPVSFGLCREDRQRQAFELASSKQLAPAFALSIADRLVSVAEAAGVVHAESDSQGSCDNLSEDGLTMMYDRIEAAMGVRIGSPEGFGIFGVRAGRHTISPTLPSDTFAALRTAQILDQVPDACIGEIGGGFGGLAHLVAQRSLTRYTIFDLPLVNALQGYYLCRTLGPDAVRLFAEPNPEAKVYVQPYWELWSLPDDSLDLIVCQETLSEIDRKIAKAHVAEIHRATRGLFLSIDQESQARIDYRGFKRNLVSELVEEHRGFHRAHRVPTWHTRGLIEELYELPDVRHQRTHSRKTASESWSKG